MLFYARRRRGLGELEASLLSSDGISSLCCFMIGEGEGLGSWNLRNLLSFSTTTGFACVSRIAITMVRRWSRAEEDRIASLVDLYIGTTRQLKQIHSHVITNGQSQNNFIAAKLVRTFAELGSLEHAQAIADDLINPNIFVWTALIRGYSLHPWLDNSSSHEAFLLYERLHQFYPEVKPLPFTLSSVLKVFDGALLSACRTYSIVEIGEIAARCLMEIEPANAGNYVLLSNIYAKVRRWDEVARVRTMMKRRGIRKEPGWSLLEMEEGRRRKFMTGEAFSMELELVLLVMSWDLKDYGYLPNMEEIEE